MRGLGNAAVEGEHHLDHVVQIVSVLEGVVLRSFGPDGGQVLFTRDTGQVMLTRHGTRILTALRLEHPLAKVVVECVWKHSGATGDGSKTFVLLLASLLRGIQGLACRAPRGQGAYASQAAQELASAGVLAQRLLAFGLEELPDVIALGVAPYCTSLSLGRGEMDVTDTDTSGRNYIRGCVDSLLPLLTAFFHTRLGDTHSDTIGRLACELLSHWWSRGEVLSSLILLDNHFSVLHTAVLGFPIGCSRVIEGQVIHRDLATPLKQTDSRPVRAVVVKESLQPTFRQDGLVLQLGGGAQSARQYMAWTERALEGVFARLEVLGVTLLLSAVKQSESAVVLARQAGVCLVECVEEEEWGLFCLLSGAEPVSDHRAIGPEHVAALTFCRPVVLGANRYVHVGFPGGNGRGESRPCGLVVCGPGEGQTEQCVGALRDALRMLLTTWDWAGSGETPYREGVTCPLGMVAPVGGAFEFLLHRALQRVSPSAALPRRTPSHWDTEAVRRLLADSVLTVPRRVYAHGPRRFLLAQSRLLRCTQTDGHPSGLTGACSVGGAADSGHGGLGSETGLESVACKHRLLLAVLQCTRSLLRVDAVLRVPCVSRAKARPRSNSSSEEDAEEEDD